MPDESKKNQKGKHEAKEQRRKRQSRQQAGPAERKQEKEPEPASAIVSEKPAYEPPGPDFYKGLKRETDEILKISEEENSKYKNKEIQSNWAKYELPIESYEEMVEKEQLGADYETLIQAPLSVGTHFQFKHEKSWDVASGPSPYQKYFDIDMGNLVIALSTIPFYERNSIDKSIFTDSDFLSMDHRAAKYKQKYYNDSKYNTFELETQIVTKLSNENKNTESVKAVDSEKDTQRYDNVNDEQSFKETNLEEKCDTPPLTNKYEILVADVTDNKVIAKNVEEKNIDEAKETVMNHLNHINTVKETSRVKDSDLKINTISDPVVTNDKNIMDNIVIQSSEVNCVDSIKISVPCMTSKESAEGTNCREEPKKPIIESPEDLEKWLDDFLDN